MVTIHNSVKSLRLSVVPEAGASIANFDGLFDGVWLPLMRPTAADDIASQNVSQMASFNLVPWSNRIVDHAFTFQGKRHNLRPNTPQGFSIHGDALRRPWRITEQHETSVTCALHSRDFSDFNFPFPFSASIAYNLSANEFRASFALTNLHVDAIPAGFGFHPYFNRGFGASAQDEVVVQFNARGIYPPLPNMQAAPIQTNLVPELEPAREVPPNMDFRAPTAIGSRVIDHCYGGWDGGATIYYPSSGVQLRFHCDASLRHVILYSPQGKSYFALEPVTHANDAFNMLADGSSSSGTAVLQPGEQLQGVFRISIDRT